MKKIIFISALLTAQISLAQKNDSLAIRKLFNEELTNGKSYQMLGYLSNRIGGRLSGSPQAAAAVEWSRQQMIKFGFDTVYLQECMVPHWVRGEKETASINSKTAGFQPVRICALGGSVATPETGLSAEVIEAYGLDDLKRIGNKAAGKIIFFNKPMDPTKITTFEAYGGAVGQRWAGATEAAKLGAVGVVVRSVTTSIDDYPHTGVMQYGKDVNKIPACAISTKGAELLSSQLKADPNLKFNFKMNCETFPDVKSYNVIGELKGKEKPDEIIVVGGHLDSWDNGDGSHDDGAGCVQSIEVLRLFKSCGIKPKRTIRAVMFMNEENGGRGGDKYAEEAKTKKEKHVAAIESDAGGFSPRGFSMDATPEQRAKIKSWIPLLIHYGLYDFDRKGAGADVENLHEQGAVTMELLPDSQRYFDIHHTENDVFANINKRELELGAASMAALVYLISEYGVQ